MSAFPCAPSVEGCSGPRCDLAFGTVHLSLIHIFDKEYNGEAWVAEGARVGYLEQEPQLDASKTVRENVMLGVAKQKAILDRYNELAMNYSDAVSYTHLSQASRRDGHRQRAANQAGLRIP